MSARGAAFRITQARQVHSTTDTHTMQTFAPRVGRWPLALIFAATTGLGACADEPTAPKIPSLSGPNANLGDIITVTTTSGGEVIRFAPALAGATIVVDSTIPVRYPITVEGPQDKGVTISGGSARHIFDVAAGLPSATTFRNLALVNGE